MASVPLATAYVRIRPDLSRFKTETETGVASAQLGKKGEAEGKTFGQRFGASASKLMVAGLVGGAIVQGLKKVIGDARALGLSPLKVAVKDAGGQWDTFEKKMKAADAQMVKFGFDSADTHGALTNLVTITGSTKDGFNALGTAADFARFKHITLTDASKLLGKAAAGNTRALKDVGITAQQLPKHFSTAGTAASRLDKIMHLMGGRIGGEATAYTKTFGGRMAIVHAQLTDTSAAIGTALIPVISQLATILVQDVVPMLKGAADWLGKFSRFFVSLPGPVQKSVIALLLVVGAVNLVRKAMIAFGVASKIASFANPWFLLAAAIVAVVVLIITNWSKIKPFLEKVWGAIKFGLGAFAVVVLTYWKLIVTSVLAAIGVLVHAAASAFGWVPGIGRHLKDADKAFQSFKSGVGNAFDSMIGKAKSWMHTTDDTGKNAQENAAKINTAFSHQQQAAGLAKKSLDQLSVAVQRNGAQSEQAKVARNKLILDLRYAGVNAGQARKDVTRYTDAVRDNGAQSDQAKKARQQLVKDIADAFNNSRQGRADIKKYTDEVRKNGTDSDGAKAARHKLITDLIDSGVSAHDARKLVDKLTGAIDAMHGKQVTVSVLGKGSGLLAYKLAVPHEMTGKGTLAFHAEGGLVKGSGGPRDDSNLIAASRGEYVHKARAVSKYGVPAMHAINEGRAIVRYADGGLVGLAKQVGQPVPWMSGAETKFARAAEDAWGKAAIRLLERTVQQSMRPAGWPFPTKNLSQLRRIDEGQDMQYPGTSPVNIYAILPGRRTTLGPDPGGFGNAYPGQILDHPVYGFKAIYYGHVLPAGKGGHLNTGDIVGRTMGATSGGDAAGLSNWLELGFIPISWANGPAMHRLLTSRGGSSVGAARGGSWTVGGMARLWDQAGGPRNLAHLMGAVGMAESGGRAWIRNSIGASGLWQILMPQNASYVHGNVFNPSVNAAAAVDIYRQQGLRAWEAYTNGSYRQFMGGGGLISEPVFGIGRSGRSYVLGEHGEETVVPGRFSSAGIEQRVDQLTGVVAQLPDMIGTAVADALDGVSRRGSYRGAYSAR